MIIGRSLVVVAALAGPVAADTLADAIAKSDIAGLRAQLADPAARCALGVVYGHTNDIPRAKLYLANCDDVPAEISAEVARTRREVDAKADPLAVVEVDSKQTLIAETDALPGERFEIPTTLWVKPGTWEIRAAVDAASLDAKRGVMNHVTTEPHKRTFVLLALPVVKQATPRDGKVDFDQEPAEHHEGPPPAIKHPPLTQGKWNGDTVVGLDGQEHATGDHSQWIDEPRIEAPDPTYAPSQRIIVRAGIAVSRRLDQSAEGVDVGLEHHLSAPFEPIGATHPYELISRIDWSERGYHVLGASIAAGKIVAAPSAARLGLALGLHGQVRFDDTLNNMPLSRFGLDAAASAELAMRDVPLDFGVRFEQGLNHIVPGARERAVIFEIGLEFRDFKK